MTSSPHTVHAWERSLQRQREQDQHHHVHDTLGFLFASLIAVGLALLAAVLSRGA